MKRYNMNWEYDEVGELFNRNIIAKTKCKLGIIELELIENPEGEWVKYEDVKKIRTEAYEAGYFMGQNSAIIRFPIKPIEGVECHCVAQSQVRRNDMGLSPSWICPAHGYKRL